MLIQIVSYKSALSTSERIRLTASIINSSVADLILFSGHTLDRSCDIKRLNQKISNKKSIAVIEVWQNYISEINPVENSLFLLFDGVVKNPTITIFYADGSLHDILKDGNLQDC